MPNAAGKRGRGVGVAHLVLLVLLLGLAPPMRARLVAQAEELLGELGRLHHRGGWEEALPEAARSAVGDLSAQEKGVKRARGSRRREGKQEGRTGRGRVLVRSLTRRLCALCSSAAHGSETAGLNLICRDLVLLRSLGFRMRFGSRSDGATLGVAGRRFSRSRTRTLAVAVVAVVVVVVVDGTPRGWRGSLEGWKVGGVAADGGRRAAGSGHQGDRRRVSGRRRP